MKKQGREEKRTVCARLNIKMEPLREVDCQDGEVDHDEIRDNQLVDLLTDVGLPTLGENKMYANIKNTVDRTNN